MKPNEEPLIFRPKGAQSTAPVDAPEEPLYEVDGEVVTGSPDADGQPLPPVTREEAASRRAAERARRVADYHAHRADDTRDLSAARDAARAQARQKRLDAMDARIEEERAHERKKARATRAAQRRAADRAHHGADDPAADSHAGSLFDRLRAKAASVIPARGAKAAQDSHTSHGEKDAGQHHGTHGTNAARASHAAPTALPRAESPDSEAAGKAERHRAAVAAAATVPDEVPGGARDPHHRNRLLDGGDGTKPRISPKEVPGAVAQAVTTAVHDPECPGRKVLVAVVCVLVVVAMLYAPIRDSYKAHRDHEVYEAQLAAINANNAEVKASIDKLQTEEGIEDEARRHGYVKEGETPAEVPGLDDGETDGEAKAAPTLSAEDVDTGPDPWYVSVLDVLFGYQKGQ